MIHQEEDATALKLYTLTELPFAMLPPTNRRPASLGFAGSLHASNAFRVDSADMEALT